MVDSNRNPFHKTVQSHQTQKKSIYSWLASSNYACKWFRKSPNDFTVQKNILSIYYCRRFWSLFTKPITKDQLPTLWSTSRLLLSHLTHAFLLLRYWHLWTRSWNPYPKTCIVRCETNQRKTWNNNSVRWEYDLFWQPKQMQNMDQLGYQSKSLCGK